MRGRTLERLLDSHDLARLAFDALGDKQAADLVILDIRPVSTITDYFVLGTAESMRQMKAAAEAVEDSLRDDGGIKPSSREGDPSSGWMLLDYGNVVVHIFDSDRRAFYDLETLWSDAPLVVRMA